MLESITVIATLISAGAAIIAVPIAIMLLVATRRHDESVTRSYDRLYAMFNILQGHEVRTPLTVIVSSLEVLSKEGPLPVESRQKIAETAFQRAKELERLLGKYGTEGR